MEVTYTTQRLDHLGILADICDEMLNEDGLGRALDAIFEAGLTEVFAQVASHSLRHFGIEYRFVHLDLSSFHLHGEYDQEVEEAPGVVRITQAVPPWCGPTSDN